MVSALAVPQIAAVFLVRNERVYLNRRGPGAETYADHWQNAGGKIEPGELPITAAQRETKEEAGLDFSPSRFIELGEVDCLSENGTPYRVFVFQVFLLPHECPIRAELKASEWSAFAINDVVRLHPVVPALCRSLAFILPGWQSLAG